MDRHPLTGAALVALMIVAFATAFLLLLPARPAVGGAVPYDSGWDGRAHETRAPTSGAAAAPTPATPATTSPPATGSDVQSMRYTTPPAKSAT
jgi:hypothetical protein